MVSKNTTLISVSRETKVNLDKLKIYKSICYNDAIIKLINFWNDNHNSQESFEVPIVPEEPSIEVTEETTLDEISEQNQIKPEELFEIPEDIKFTETGTSTGN